MRLLKNSPSVTNKVVSGNIPSEVTYHTGTVQVRYDPC